MSERVTTIWRCDSCGAETEHPVPLQWARCVNCKDYDLLCSTCFNLVVGILSHLGIRHVAQRADYSSVPAKLARLEIPQ